MSVESISEFLESHRKSFVFSGYQVWAEHGGKLAQWTGGATSYWPGAVTVDARTFFDIGSVTKAVATTSILARWIDSKKIGLSDTIGQHLPALRSGPLGALSVKSLLTHSSGLKAWLDLSGVGKGLSALVPWLEKNAASWVSGPPGSKTEYSDLGFLCLGLVVEAVARRPFEDVFENEVRSALGLSEVIFGPIPKGRAVAATEVRENLPLSGIVFDENCTALGGLTSHAGLFATAEGLAPWCREWLNATQGNSRWISKETALLFTGRSNSVPKSSWALGWDTKSEAGSSAGTLFSSTSFGHLGYPGCSVWIDPLKSGWVVFLSNRVHPSRLDERIRKVRPVLHDRIAETWG
jgi:serine-type D-Ala-D-Ala carboxypeptidase